LRQLETTDPKHPNTWNPNYQTLINNDVFLKQFADELVTARGAAENLDERIAGVENTVESASPEFTDALAATLKFALDQAATANYGVRALRELNQQEGLIRFVNRGVVSGCAVTKSSTATRNLNIGAGVCFAQGRKFTVAEGANAASVPSNTAGGAVTVYAYLYQTDAGWSLAVTPIGQPVPDGGIVLYNLTLPANSTDASDPNLTAVTLIDVRRIEAGFPLLADSPAQVAPEINPLPDEDYNLTFDVLSSVGAPADAMSLVVASRASNGFTVRLASAADDVVARWRLSRLNA
jgi:hypothetical protein